jgi:hypothetical protein
MPNTPIPRRYATMNRIMRFMSSIGIAPGPVRIMTLPGRTSGKPLSSPVSPVVVDGRRFVVSAQKNSNWAKNARAAAYGELRKGRASERVTLTEVDDDTLRRTVMSVYPRQVPAGVSLFTTLGVVTSADPAEWAEARNGVDIFELNATDAR